MLSGVHLHVDLGNPAVRIDQKGVTFGELDHAQVGIGAKALGHLPARVGEQREGQALLLGKVPVGICRIQADADHLGVQFSKPGLVVPEIDGFRGAAGRVVLGVEVEHDPFSLPLG